METIARFVTTLVLMTLGATATAAQAPLQQHPSAEECSWIDDKAFSESAGFANSPQRRLVSLAATAIPVGLGILLISNTDGGSEGRSIANSVVLWSGPLIGPSAGYWSGDRERGLLGVLLRSAVFTTAWVIAPTKDFNDGFLPNPEWERLGAWAAAAGVILVSDIVDIITAR